MKRSLPRKWVLGVLKPHLTCERFMGERVWRATYYCGFHTMTCTKDTPAMAFNMVRHMAGLHKPPAQASPLVLRTRSG